MNNNDQSAGDDGSGIRPETLSEKILRMWQGGRTLQEIRIELNLPIEIVERELKKEQKKSIPKGTPKGYEYKDG